MTAPTAAPRAKVIEKPMLFSGSMVRAILDGRKTMTRRIIKLDDPEEWPSLATSTFDADDEIVFQDEDGVFKHSVGKCPHPIGSRIWVRETWALSMGADCDSADGRQHNGWKLFYRADDSVHSMGAEVGGPLFMNRGSWRPSIHMPRWASRITLEVTDVRVERLQDIAPQDAIAEGIERINDLPMDPNDFTACWRNYDEAEAAPYWNSPIDSFRSLWVSINGRDSLKENPLVWAYTFKQLSTEATHGI